MTIFKHKTILVTGGAGFVGSNLCDELIKHNPSKLIIYDNLCASTVDNIKHLLNDTRVEFIKADVVDYESLEPHVLRSDFVFHLAAGNVGNSVISPKTDVETNIIGTYNVLKAAEKNVKVKVVHASSGSVVNPTTPYAISKLAGEQYCLFYAKEYGLNVTVARYHHVFGPRQDMNGKCGVINIFLKRILNGLRPVVWGTGEAIKCFTFISDIVSATILLAEKGKKGKVYDVASETRVSIDYLAHLLIKRYSKEDVEPMYDKPKIGENMELYPDTSLIKELGWDARMYFEDALDVTKEWVRLQLTK